MKTASLLFPLLVLGAVASTPGCAADSEPTADDDVGATDEAISAGSSLADVITFLGQGVHTRSPGTELAIAVHDLKTGESHQLNGDVKHTSASSAKAIWVAAALDKVDDARVEPLAHPVFQVSDNDAAGRVIDLIGPNAENVFYDRAGMHDSGFIQWDFNKTREATNRGRPLGSNNYFTANDAIRFLTKFHNGTLLKPASRALLMDWMKESPNSGVGGWLGARLPPAVQATMRHKAGWLPPPLESEQTNEIGIIDAEPGGGHRYAVAIFTRHGNDYWGKQAPFVEFASCLIYRAISKDTGLHCVP